MGNCPSNNVYWGPDTVTCTSHQCPCIVQHSLPSSPSPPPDRSCPIPVTDQSPPPREVRRDVLQVLKVRKIDPCADANGREHRTDGYELMKSKDDPQLVVRRGQRFFLLILLERDYSAQNDGVSFVFRLEGEYQTMSNTSPTLDATLK